MAKSLKNLLSQTVIYGLSSIVGRFLNYCLVPLYTYKIAADSGGYGVVTNLYAYTALILVLLTFGMETTFFRFNRRQEGEPANPKVFSTAAWAVGLVATLFLLLITLFLGPISNALHYTAHPEFVEIMAIIVAMDAFQAILFARLRSENRAWKFATLKLSFIIANVLLNLFVFLVVPYFYTSHPTLFGWYNPSYQVGYIFILNLICTAAVMLGFIPELKDMRYGIDKLMLKQMLQYTWPLLLLGIAGILNQVADKICYRFIVPGLEGEVQLGIYGACVKIAMIMALITQAFRYAYEPFVFSGNRDKADKQQQADVMKYFVMFTLFAFLAVMCYIDLFKYIIRKDYWDGLRAVPIVMMAEIFMGIYFNLSFWYKTNDREKNGKNSGFQTYWGAIFSTIGCVVLLTINFLFVPEFGYMACAWAGFAGYGVCMLLSYIVGQRKAPIPYNVGVIVLCFAVALSLFFVTTLIKTDSLLLSLVIKTAILLVYIAFVLYMERALVRKVVGAIKRKLFHKQ